MTLTLEKYLLYNRSIYVCSAGGDLSEYELRSKDQRTIDCT
jgi:hypothetical protein